MPVSSRLPRPLFTAWAVAVAERGIIKSLFPFGAGPGRCARAAGLWAPAGILCARITRGRGTFTNIHVVTKIFDQAAPRPVFPGCQSNKGRITPSIAVLRNTEWCRGPGVARHGAQQKNLEEFPVHACPVCLDSAPSCLKRPRHAGQDQLSMPAYMARLTSLIM